MTTDDIIRMGHEADVYANCEWDTETLAHHWKQYRDAHFAALVAAAEREKCALVCESLAHEWECLDEHTGAGTCFNWKAEACRVCANDIRSRSQP